MYAYVQIHVRDDARAHTHSYEIEYEIFVHDNIIVYEKKNTVKEFTRKTAISRRYGRALASTSHLHPHHPHNGRPRKWRCSHALSGVCRTLSVRQLLCSCVRARTSVKKSAKSTVTNLGGGKPAFLKKFYSIEKHFTPLLVNSSTGEKWTKNLPAAGRILDFRLSLKLRRFIQNWLMKKEWSGLLV